MLMYEVNSDVPEFRYKIWLSREGELWSIDHIQVIFRSEPLLPKRKIRGDFTSEEELITRAVKWCDALVDHLLHSDIPVPELLPDTPITIDQLPSLQEVKGAA